MAVYKPNNFYPRLQEVDLTKQNGNIFSCQVNTDGSFINGADLKIYSEENVLLYHNLYDFSEYPVPDGEFLGMNVLPYRVHCEKYNGSDLTNEDDKIFILSDVSFINLNPDIAFDERKDYCPYNFFNLRFKNSISFGIKFIINEKEFIYPFSIIPDNTHFYSGVEDENGELEIINTITNGIEPIGNNKYNIYINIEKLDLSILEQLGSDITLETYIVLLNNKDYYWDVQLYEHKFNSEDYKNKNEATLLAEGYITGSTKNVLWWDKSIQSDEVIMKDKEIKEDNYIEITATSKNSDLFEEQLKLGRVDNGVLTNNNFSLEEDGLLIDSNFVDLKEYMDYSYLYIDFQEHDTIKNMYQRYVKTYTDDKNESNIFYYKNDKGIVSFLNKENCDNVHIIENRYVEEKKDDNENIIGYEEKVEYYYDQKEINKNNSIYVKNVVSNIDNDNNDIMNIRDIIYSGDSNENNIELDFIFNYNCYKYSESKDKYTCDSKVSFKYTDKINCFEEIKFSEYEVVGTYTAPLYTCYNDTTACSFKSQSNFDTKDENGNYIYNHDKYIKCSKRYSSEYCIFYISIFYNGEEIHDAEYKYYINKNERNDFYHGKKLEVIYNNLEKVIIQPFITEEISYFIDKSLFKKKYFKIKEQNKKKDYCILHLANTEKQNEIIKLLNTEDFYSLDFYACLKQREKITWVTKNIGNNNNFYKIELENDLIVNLQNFSSVDLYSSNNKNTNYTFFGVKDSDINVDNIYVRFPGYVGNDYNGDFVNDILSYYEEQGTVDPIINDGNNTISVNPIAVRGNFYQNYDNNQTLETLQSIDIYGKNVDEERFENNTNNGISVYNNEYDSSQPATLNNFDFIEFKSDGRTADYRSGESRPELCLRIIISKNEWWEIKYDQRRYDWANYAWVQLDFAVDIQRPNTGLSARVKLKTDYDEKCKKCWRIDGETISSDSDWFNDGHIIRNIKGIYFDLFHGGFALTETKSKTGIILGKNGIKNKILTIYGERCFYDSNDWKKEKENVGLSNLNYNSTMNAYCKLYKVSSYDYETGEFVLAGGLEREITENEKYEVWEKTVTEEMTNSYNITEVKNKFTRIYPSHDKYNEIAYVGDYKAIDSNIIISNNTNNQIFIQPNINFYNNEYNSPYLLLDNNNERINLSYSIDKKDNGFTIEENNYDKLDGSQWLFNLKNETKEVPKSGQFYKLYMDTCGVSNQNWFYGRTIENINIRIGEYNYINQLIKSNKIKINDFNDKKLNCIDIEKNKNGERCIVPYVDCYFMCTCNNLTVPIKRYRYILYDNFMKVISDSGYIYDILTSFPIKGLRNEETYLLNFEMEDQLGYVYRKDIPLIAKYNEYKIDDIMLKLECDAHQGCISGDFICEDINLEIYNAEEINIVNDSDILEDSLNKNYRYCNKLDFNRFGSRDKIYVYKRNKEKLLHFVCVIDLNNPIITENNQEKIGFIDYGVVNNEYYDYVVILACDNPYVIEDKNEMLISDVNYTYIEERCKTCFDGWILVDLEQDIQEENIYYVKDNIWNFKYNLESQDLTQNTSVKQWDTLGKYANVYVGKKNYISSGLSCLLGDVGYYESFDGKNIHKKYGYFEKDLNSINYDNGVVSANESMNNNIDKYLQWKTFNSNGTPKLLKDYKGNMWIVQILEKPTVKNADNSNEQIYTISFNWVEIEDVKKYSILGKETSIDDYSLIEQQIEDYWDYEFDKNNSLYLLTGLKPDYDYSNINYENPIIIGGDINIGNTLVKGVLQTNYYIPPYQNSEELIITKDIFMNIGDYEGDLYVDFSSELLIKDLRNIDDLYKGLSQLKRVNINFTDNIESAQNLFSGTNIRTDNKYQIQINTNNYINMKGIFDNISFGENTEEGIIIVKWGIGATNPDLRLYHELYSQYWNNSNIILDCCYTLKYEIIDGEKTIKDWICEFDSDLRQIILKEYNGNLKKVYIPKQMLIDGDDYTVVYSPN